uniref:ANK_REP_REGION domain-containing protein n=1 Tax=Heterorhabditis bacteriophora TaxID=37862 RepID=A0A1I7X633_HETBA
MNQLESLRILLSSGSDLCKQDAQGKTVVHWAAASSLAILEEISSASSFHKCLEILDGDGLSPLGSAIRSSNFETVQLLMGLSAPLGPLSSGPLLNAVVGMKHNESLDNGENALMKAVKNGNPMMVKVLLVFDSDLCATNLKGYNVFKYTESSKKRVEIETLLNMTLGVTSVQSIEMIFLRVTARIMHPFWNHFSNQNMVNKLLWLILEKTIKGIYFAHIFGILNYINDISRF